MKKRYVTAFGKLTNTSAAGWSARSDAWQERMRARQVQISYVIEFAAAARKHGFVTAES